MLRLEDKGTPCGSPLNIINAHGSSNWILLTLLGDLARTFNLTRSFAIRTFWRANPFMNSQNDDFKVHFHLYDGPKLGLLSW
jgi:hypothetical protein